MSRKLVTIIQDIKGFPGKYKRVLQAWASFANNDGSNIFASKEAVAQRAGVSRWTVYENTDVLEAVGVMLRTSSHVCKTKDCNKGGTHFTSQHGQYTVVYKINVALLENPTVLLQKLADPTVVKAQKVTGGKSRKGTVVKPDATQALKETLAPLGITETLPLVPSGSEVSQLVSEEEATPPSPVKPEKQKPDHSLWEQGEPEPHPYWSEALGRGLDISEVDVAEDLYLDLLPNGYMNRADVITLAELAISYGMPFIRSIWFWNRLHKEGGLKFRTIAALAEALASESDNNVVMQYQEHDFAKCPKCKKLRTCVQCGKREDGTECRDYMDAVKRGTYPAGGYMHKGCEYEWYEGKRSMAAAAVGKGFDVEEAE